MNNKKHNVYLDYGASSPISEGVLETIINTSASVYGNPSSAHDAGKRAKNVVEECRNSISKLINANPEDKIVFTSGATESNSIAVQGYLHHYLHNLESVRNAPRIYYSAIEHSDLVNCCKDMTEMMLCDTFVIPVFDDGKINIDALDNMLMNAALECGDDGDMFHPLVIVQGANSEIGTIQDLESISRIVHEYKGYLMSDITQLLPYKEVDVNKLGIDIATDSAHKFGSLKGVGFMYVRNGINLSSIIFGDQGLRGGTENVVGIASMNTAIKELSNNYHKKRIKLNAVRNQLYLKLKTVRGVHFIGCKNRDRICNNLAFYNSNCKLSAQQIVELCNEEGFYISAGTACHNYSPDPSKTLIAIGLDRDTANKVIRVTVGESVSYSDIDDFVDFYQKIVTHFAE